ncbi:MAG: uracil phosphoribosyltransferase [Chlamydiota bacterium]|jgi:uracil phosphoribosyltransferase
MKQSLLTILRNKKTSKEDFRKAANKLCSLIASDASSFLSEEKISVETPLQKGRGTKVIDNLILLPILRSGMVMLPAFLNLYETAKVGFMGIRRDEETALPHIYYENFPTISKNDTIFVLDPMIATGGSTIACLKKLEAYKATLSNIFVVSLISSKPGVTLIKKTYPDVSLYSVSVDPSLNDKKFILPGLGDFGDRFFGT